MKGWARFPFVRYTAALASGILLFLGTDTAPHWLWSVELIAASFTLFFAFTRPRRQSGLLWAGIPALLFLFVSGWLLTSLRFEGDDPTHFGKQSPILGLQVNLTSLPERKSYGFRAFAEVEQVKTLGGWQSTSGKILLEFTGNLPFRPNYGDVLLLKGEPRPIQSPLNPGEFDYNAFLARQQVFHRLRLRPKAVLNVGNQPAWAIQGWAYRLNRYADSVMTHHLTKKREYGVVKAMLLGVREDIDLALTTAYSAAGAVHVLSVSGLHVGILFILLEKMFGWIRQRKRGALLFLGLVLPILWFYAALTGFSPPVLRSTLMFSLFVTSDALVRSRSNYNVLFASAFLLLLWEPFWLTSPGFQLSYLAVLGIMYLQPRIQTWIESTNPVLNATWAVTATALAAQLATFPLCIFYFHQFPVYFLFVNPVVIGLSSAALPIGLFFLLFSWVPGLNDFMAFWLEATTWLLNESVVQVERLPRAVWRHLHFTGWEAVGFAGLILALLALFHTKRKGYAFLSASFALCLGMVAFFTKLQQHRQQWVVVHQVPRQTALSFVSGNTLRVLADSTLVAQPRQLDFACAGFWAERGVRFVEWVNVPSVQPPVASGIVPIANGWATVWHEKSIMAIHFPLNQLD
ncbi:MAG: ComEC family competence protein, partial [Sphingobacteriaceae bacterium]|nr:ComEC family competence protein [Cytophagaceae bacterium]